MMMWGGIGYDNKTDEVFIAGRINSQQYDNLLENQLKNYFLLVPKENVIFQQDNPPVDTVKVANPFIRKEGISILDWPARSPGLNIIDYRGTSCWSAYSGIQKFQRVEELKNNNSESNFLKS